MKQVIEWLFQRITGAVLLAGLIVHFYIMHYSGSGQVSYHAILARISHPYWKTFNILFLLAAIYHGFNGLLGIVLDYVRSREVQIALEVVLVVTAMVLTGIGVYILAV